MGAGREGQAGGRYVGSQQSSFLAQCWPVKMTLETAKDIFMESMGRRASAGHGALEVSGLLWNSCVKWICVVANGTSLKLKTELGETAAWETPTCEMVDVPQTREP